MPEICAAGFFCFYINSNLLSADNYRRVTYGELWNEVCNCPVFISEFIWEAFILLHCGEACLCNLLFGTNTKGPAWPLCRPVADAAHPQPYV